MYRGRVFIVPLCFVAPAGRLASVVHIFSRPGRSAILHRAIPHAYRSLAVRSPPSAIGGRGRLAVSWRDRHKHFRVYGLLRDGRAGVRGFAVAAFQWSPSLGRVHRLGCGRMADHQRRPTLRGVFPGRAARAIVISPVEVAFGAGRRDTRRHSFGSGAG